jgi:hypothetical protein
LIQFYLVGGKWVERKKEEDGGLQGPGLQPFLRNLPSQNTIPGDESPGYCRVIPPGLPKRQSSASPTLSRVPLGIKGGGALDNEIGFLFPFFYVQHTHERVSSGGFLRRLGLGR